MTPEDEFKIIEILEPYLQQMSKQRVEEAIREIKEILERVKIGDH